MGCFDIEGAVIAADMLNVGWRKGTAHENKIRFQPLCVQLVQIYTDSFSQLIEYDLRPAIFRYESAERLSELAVQAGKRASIHIALDTGMSRIGYMVTAAAADETARISRLPGIRIEGLFTHFARADEKDKGATDRQMELFAIVPTVREF